MSVFTRRTVITSAIGVAAVALAACGEKNAGPATESGSEAQPVTLKIGASPKPHAEILQFVQDNLAKKNGLNLEIVQYTDYQIPNQALDSGDIDGNYYQHLPFLKSQQQEKGYKFYAFPEIHIEPLGVYSRKVKALNELPEGGEIALPNDPTNRGRALALLAANNVISLNDGIEPGSALVSDVKDNPKQLKFTEVDAQQIPRSLDDFAAGVINGNVAIAGGLNPAQDALVLESGEKNPYANLLVVRETDKDNVNLKKLNDLLHSNEVKEFIQKTYNNGSVLPAF